MNKLTGLLTVLIVMMVGCVFFDDTSGKKPGEYLDSYFPLNPKLKKTYVVETYMDSIKVTNELVRYSYNGTTKINGNTYHLIQNDESEKPSYYRIEDDIVYRYYNENEKIFIPMPHEEPMLDFSKSPGESWQVISFTQPENDGETTYTLTTTYHGNETINIIGGTFNDCAHYSSLEKAVFTPKNGDSTQTYTSEMNYELWYYKGIGLVKSTAVGDIFLRDYTVELFVYTLAD
ncbi:hypothetical protein ACFL30_01475 [Candidatus Latescibacterota bacterium]